MHSAPNRSFIRPLDEIRFSWGREGGASDGGVIYVLTVVACAQTWGYSAEVSPRLILTFAAIGGFHHMIIPCEILAVLNWHFVSGACASWEPPLF